MGDAEFPALGFDPARGNVNTVRDLARQMLDTADYAKEAHEVLQSSKDKRDVWQGQAADAWNAKLGELPQYLDAAHTSLEGAGRGLQTWSDKLQAHQAKAHELEQQCKQAIQQAQQADAAAAQAGQANAPIAYDANNPAAADAANAQAQANADAADRASSAASEAWDRVDDIRRQAEDLRDRYEDDAKACQDALSAAGDKAPSTSWLDSAGDWVGDHLKDIGDWAGVVGAVAGVLAFIPVLTPVMGPIALVAGGVALAAHGADMVKNDKLTQPSAWVGLGADVVGMLPGVGAVSRGVAAAGRTLREVDGLGAAAAVGGRTMMRHATEAPEAAKVFRTLGGKISTAHERTIARATQNTLALGTSGNTALSKTGVLPREVSTPAGHVGSGITGAKSWGTWGKTGNALSMAGTSLANFARACG